MVMVLGWRRVWGGDGVGAGLDREMRLGLKMALVVGIG